MADEDGPAHQRWIVHTLDGDKEGVEVAVSDASRKPGPARHGSLLKRHRDGTPHSACAAFRDLLRLERSFCSVKQSITTGA